MTPMPPRPAAVAIAAMVSRLISPLGMGRLVAVEHALDLPLLQDRKNVVDQPVEHQPAGKKKKKMLKTNGMNFMTRAWTGSGGTGFILVCSTDRKSTRLNSSHRT